MRKFTVSLCLMALLVAIVPQPVRAGSTAETIETIAGIYGLYSIVSDLTRSGDKTPKVQPQYQNQGQLIQPNQQFTVTQWIAIDDQYTQTDGNYGNQVKAQAIELLKLRAAQLGIGVAVIGGDYDMVTSYQDQTQSGRYNKDMAIEVAPGNMIPAGRIFKLVLVSDVQSVSKEGHFASKAGVRLSADTITSKVTVRLLGINVKTGVISSGYEGKSSYSRTCNFNLDGYLWDGFLAGGRISRQDMEMDTAMKAIDDAVNIAINQLATNLRPVQQIAPQVQYQQPTQNVQTFQQANPSINPSNFDGSVSGQRRFVIGNVNFKFGDQSLPVTITKNLYEQDKIQFYRFLANQWIMVGEYRAKVITDKVVIMEATTPGAVIPLGNDNLKIISR